MDTTVRRPAVNVGPHRAHPGLALLLAAVSIPGSTIAWELPAGGLWIGLPLGIAAIVLALRARRDDGASRTTTAALVLAMLAVGQMLVWSVSSAAAMPPLRVAYPIDRTVEIPELTALCGFQVTESITGVSKGTIFQDRSGAIVRELDTQPDTQFILRSPTTGESFSYPWAAAFHYDYPEGTAPGSAAIVRITGLGDKVPGVPASAGQIVFADAVVLFVEDGVPIVDFGIPTYARGHSNDPGAVDAAICAALA